MMLAREQLREHALAPGMEFNEGFTFFLSNEVFCRREEGEPKSLHFSKATRENPSFDATNYIVRFKIYSLKL